MTIFRNTPKDSLLVLYAVVMFLLPVVLAFYTPGLLWLIIISFFHIWFIVNGQNSSMHHHTHWSTFNNQTANRAYEIFLAMTFGIATAMWRWTHLIHHKHVNDKPVNGKTVDPVSVYKLEPADGTLNNFWVYCFKGAFIDNIKPVFTWFKFTNPQLAREMWAFRLFILLICSINLFYGLWLLAIYCLSFIVNNANSYGEHWGALTRRGDTTQDSVGIYSKWYNIFGFGAGYHQEHHHRPGVHWTKLHLITPLLHPDRVIKKHGVHITNNPFWDHFVLLLKKEKAVPK